VTPSVPRPRNSDGLPASTVTVGLARQHDQVLATGVLVGAFSVPPLGGWIDPDPLTRDRHLVRHVTPLVAAAFTQGVVYLATEVGLTRAGALWTPQPPQPPASPSDEVGEVAGPVRRLRYLTEVTAAAYPGTPHETLIVAVRSADVSARMVRAVLGPRLQDLDQAGTPSFTVATSPDLQATLAACGYRTYHSPIVLPDSTVEVWPMRREPRAQW
jgi:hypothetical protein